jgi:NCAIR mutase (PurE)-related protein
VSDEPDNLTHRMLRDIREVLGRLAVTSLEVGVAGVNRRLDQVDSRLERLERRAGLLEAHEQ